jgi:peptidoglycan/LPS O-acetylase OafA/YrhL
MPFIFNGLGTSLKSWDDYFGEMSYPIYITHFIVLNRIPMPSWLNPLPVTIIVAVAFIHLIMRPIDRGVRSRILKQDTVRAGALAVSPGSTPA